MPLRGKKPEDQNPRLRALMYSRAGVGKTTAAIQMPKPYIIDTERGTDHYGDTISKQQGVVFQTVNPREVITEIKSLISEDHGYLTLVIDPFTTLYDALVEEGERVVGTEWGRQYGYANKFCKRLYNLFGSLDMNIIITSHIKNAYEGGQAVGETFDGWKKMDYLFDLVFHLERDKSGKRIATVRKTRLAEFPDQTSFEWSYQAVAERYGKERLEKAHQVVKLASDKQVSEFEALLAKLSPEELKRLKIDKVVNSVEDISDLGADRIDAGIKLIKKHLGR